MIIETAIEFVFLAIYTKVFEKFSYIIILVTWSMNKNKGINEIVKNFVFVAIYINIKKVPV